MSNVATKASAIERIEQAAGRLADVVDWRLGEAAQLKTWSGRGVESSRRINVMPIGKTAEFPRSGGRVGSADAEVLEVLVGNDGKAYHRHVQWVFGTGEDRKLMDNRAGSRQLHSTTAQACCLERSSLEAIVDVLESAVRTR